MVVKGVLSLLFLVLLISCVDHAAGRIEDGDMTINVTSSDDLTFNLVLLKGEEDSDGLSNEMVSAFKLSVEMMNRNAQITSNKFQIKYTILRTRSLCHEDNMGLLINSSVVGVVGSLGTVCSTALKEKLAKSKIPQISFLPPAEQIAAAEERPMLSVSPSRSRQGEVLAALVQHYNWNTVSIVEEKSLNSLGLSIQLQLEAHGISVDPVILVNERKIESQLDKIKQSSTRVIVLLVKKASLRERILKIAHMKNLLSKGWYWLMTDAVTLTDSELKIVPEMRGMIGISPRSGSGKAYHQLLVEWLGKKKTSYPGKIWDTKFDETMGPYVPQVYDAALAYYKALQSLTESKHMKKGTHINLQRTALQAELRRNSNRSQAFVGATGEAIFFDPQNGDGPCVYDIVNLQDNSWRRVGWYGQEGLTISRLILWPGGNMNPGYSAVIESEPRSYESLAVVMSVVMCVFLVLTIVLYRIVLKHREKTNQFKMQQELLIRDNDATESDSFRRSHEDLEPRKQLESIL